MDEQPDDNRCHQCDREIEHRPPAEPICDDCYPLVVQVRNLP